MPMPSKADLLKENADLQARLTDAEETLRAIRMGEVDGLVVSTAQGNQVFTLQSADHPYRLMVEEMQEGAVTIGTDPNILYCNRRFAEILGYSSDQIVSHNIDQFIVLEEQENFSTFLNRVSSERNNHREFNCKTARNQVVPVYISANVLQLEQTKFICLIVTDLSEKNRLKAVVRQGETRYRSLVDAMNEGVILMNSETVIQTCNPAAEHILGLTAD
ncbi:MAG: PAS domain-containing protein, partial [Aggregatilineales bacterium]